MTWTKKTTRAVLLVAVITLSAVACGSGGSAEPSSPPEKGSAQVRDYEFKPKTITVQAGDAVTWEWDGRAPHNVAGNGFRSEDLVSGTFRHTFPEPGTYEYTCTLHPGMRGRVVVENR